MASAVVSPSLTVSVVIYNRLLHSVDVYIQWNNKELSTCLTCRWPSGKKNPFLQSSHGWSLVTKKVSVPMSPPCPRWPFLLVTSTIITTFSCFGVHSMALSLGWGPSDWSFSVSLNIFSQCSVRPLECSHKIFIEKQLMNNRIFLHTAVHTCNDAPVDQMTSSVILSFLSSFFFLSLTPSFTLPSISLSSANDN